MQTSQKSASYYNSEVRTRAGRRCSSIYKRLVIWCHDTRQPSIHYFYHLFLQGKLEPIPGDLGQKADYTPGKSAINHHNLKYLVYLQIGVQVATPRLRILYIEHSHTWINAARYLFVTKPSLECVPSVLNGTDKSGSARQKPSAISQRGKSSHLYQKRTTARVRDPALS